MKREEAIDIIRKNIPHLGIGAAEMTEALNELIPELRESEDEEIRKDIIGGLMWQRDNLKSEGPHDNNLILPGFCFTVGKHLTYLEKQKEQSLRDFIDDFPYSDQKERKPELVQHPPITFTYNSNASRDERLKAALLALLNSDLLKIKEGGYFTKQDLIEWVEQKPSWSEEDERMARFYENDYDNNLGNMPMCEVIENRIKFKDWVLNRLKSLRPQPHWKPSEEQISSLKQARDYYMSGRVKYVGRHLSEIAEQLEKLM